MPSREPGASKGILGEMTGTIMADFHAAGFHESPLSRINAVAPEEAWFVSPARTGPPNQTYFSRRRAEYVPLIVVHSTVDNVQDVHVRHFIYR